MAREGLMDDTGSDIEDRWFDEICTRCKQFKEGYDDDRGMFYIKCKSYPDCEYERIIEEDDE